MIAVQNNIAICKYMKDKNETQAYETFEDILKKYENRLKKLIQVKEGGKRGKGKKSKSNKGQNPGSDSLKPDLDS